MDTPPVHHVVTTPALPCRVCGILTTISAVERREGGRWILIPYCDKHRQPVAEAATSAPIAEAATPPS